jgi:hypothetical protein
MVLSHRNLRAFEIIAIEVDSKTGCEVLDGELTLDISAINQLLLLRRLLLDHEAIYLNTDDLRIGRSTAPNHVTYFIGKLAKQRELLGVELRIIPDNLRVSIAS